MRSWRKAWAFWLAVLIAALSTPVQASASPTPVEQEAVGTANTVESVADMAAIPEQHVIADFPILYQYPELPTGCEVVALTMAMRFYGCDVNKITMAGEYLPTAEPSFSYSGGRAHGPDMDIHFVGSPFSAEGFICGTGAICTAANSYFEDAGKHLAAQPITGSTPQQLYSLVSQDIPVVVWVTIGMVNHVDDSVWYTADGRKMSIGGYDHGAVLVGYSPTTVTIADPISGLVTYNRAQFEAAYRSRGSQSVIIQKVELYETGWYDVPDGSWYADAVVFCAGNGLMSGMGGHRFDPDGVMSRSMLAAVLYRMAGSPTAGGESPFSDVESGQWYAPGVIWANGQGIVSGYGNREFGVSDPVTREQAVTMLWRYEGEPKASQSKAFADKEEISSYARDAVDWARAAGVISGSDNRFRPQDSIMRAEMAVVLRSYMQMERKEPAALLQKDGLAPALDTWAKK